VRVRDFHAPHAVVSLHSQEPGLAPKELRIAVGGPNPANVAEAIAELRPWAQML